MFRLKFTCYESGEKAGKLLARQLKQKDTSFTIPAMENKKLMVVTGVREINDGFHDFSYQTF